MCSQIDVPPRPVVMPWCVGRKTRDLFTERHCKKRSRVLRLLRSLLQLIVPRATTRPLTFCSRTLAFPFTCRTETLSRQLASRLLHSSAPIENRAYSSRSGISKSGSQGTLTATTTTEKSAPDGGAELEAEILPVISDGKTRFSGWKKRHHRAKIPIADMRPQPRRRLTTRPLSLNR